MTEEKDKVLCACCSWRYDCNEQPKKNCEWYN